VPLPWSVSGMQIAVLRVRRAEVYTRRRASDLYLPNFPWALRAGLAPFGRNQVLAYSTEDDRHNNVLVSMVSRRIRELLFSGDDIVGYALAQQHLVGDRVVGSQPAGARRASMIRGRTETAGKEVRSFGTTDNCPLFSSASGVRGGQKDRPSAERLDVSPEPKGYF
jgi:hypothetical protein